ncbi:MAG: GumC family protein, partial [Acidobacteriota bacterium]
MSNRLPTLRSLTRERFIQRELADNLWAQDVHSWIRYLRTVFSKRKKIIIAIPLLILVSAAVQLWTTTPWYRAKVTIQIEPGRNIYLPSPALDHSVADFYTTDTYTRTQKEVLQSEILSQRVIERLKLLDNESFNRLPSRGVFLGLVRQAKDLLQGEGSEQEEPQEHTRLSLALKKLKEQLEVNHVLGTRLLELRFSSPDPELASLIANTYGEEFVTMDLETRGNRALRARASIEQQLGQVKTQLEEADAALADYAKKRHLLNIDEDQKVTLQRLVDLNQQLTQAETALVASEANMSLVANSSVDNFPPALINPKISQLEVTANNLQQRLASLLSKYGKNWPEAIQVSSELEAVNQQIRNEKQRALDEARQGYEVAQGRYELLSGLNRQQMRRASQLDQDLIQFRILRREVESNRELYHRLLERLKETSVATSLNSSDIRVLSPARLPEVPVWPKKTQTLLISLFLGLILAGGVALASEALNDTIKTPEQLERAAPVVCLGTIPLSKHGHTLEAGHPLALARTEGVESVVLIDEGVSHESWEAYKILRTSLVQGTNGEISKRILVTSSLPGEGTTSTAFYSAMSGARSGFRTVLIDMNFRRPNLDRFFAIPQGQPGLIDFLSGQGNLVSLLRRTVVPGL